jgi:hypothetical protein
VEHIPTRCSSAMAQSLFSSDPSKLLPPPTVDGFAPEGGGQSSGNRTTEDVEYLFVNKDQKSKFLSNCKADKTQTVINSHAQRFRRQARCQGKRTRLRFIHDVPRSPSRYEFQTWIMSPEETAADSKRDKRVGATDESFFEIQGGFRSKSFKRSTAPVADQPLQPVLYSNNFRKGDACDPFSTSATLIDKPTHGILQFFLSRGWKAHLKHVGKAHEEVWSQSFHNLSDIVRGCLSREVHMYALLTCNAMRMKCFGLGHFGKLPRLEYLMSKTLKALRQHFSNASEAFPVDEQVILDIFFLAFSEFYRQDYAAMKTHLYMIRSVVGLFGGFENVSDYIREACCYTEICFSAETGEACVFDMTWDPGPIPASRWVRVQATLASGKIQPLGAGFRNPLQDQFFNVRTAKIIEDLMIDILVFEFIRKDEEALPSDSWWACTRTRALVHRLLSLAKRDKVKKQSIKELRVQCVTTTLIMYLCCENSYMIPLRSLPFILSRLKRSLQLSNSNFSLASVFSWNGHADMLLWIVVTGFWLSGADGSADAIWFLSRAVHGCKVLGLASVEELRSLMERFLWIEHLQKASLMKLAGHVLIARGEALEAFTSTSLVGSVPPSRQECYPGVS